MNLQNQCQILRGGETIIVYTVLMPSEYTWPIRDTQWKWQFSNYKTKSKTLMCVIKEYFGLKDHKKQGNCFEY